MGSTKKTKKDRTAAEGPVASTSELARRLNLSRWTVSRVLNGHGGVRPETARLIRDAVEEHGFLANPLARGLRLGRTNIVGVCVPDIEHFHLARKVGFLRGALASEGFELMLSITSGHAGDEARKLNHFRSLCAAGVVLFASNLAPTHPAVRRFEEEGVPLVMVDPVAKAGRGCLLVDRAVAMREAAGHLLALGHRRFAALGLGEGEPGSYRSIRLAATEAALRAGGVSPRHGLLPIALPGEEGGFYEAGCAAAKRFLALPGKTRPTAVLALNDRVALGFVSGLVTGGCPVPGEVSVIGWDNMEAGSFFTPALTTVDARSDELISRAAAHLLRRILHPGKPAGPRVRIIPKLVVRGSTGPARPV